MHVAPDPPRRQGRDEPPAERKVVPLFSHDRKPHVLWSEICEWLGSPDYPENPPAGLASELSAMMREGEL